MNKEKLLLYTLLCWGITVWLMVPILGIFPMLLYIQLDLLTNKRKKKHNNLLDNFILVLIVLSLSIFCSSLTVYSDTEVYVDTYKSLDWNELFNLSYGNGLEFMTFVLAYPIHSLTNGSPYWFLLNQSLIINALVVFVISKKISEKYYPLLLIIVFATSWYYTQVFLMRQVLSLTFLLLAIVNIKSRIEFFIYSLLSFFSHISSFPYIILLIIIKTISSTRMKIDNNLINTNSRKRSRQIRLIILISVISIVTVSIISFGIFSFAQIASSFAFFFRLIGLSQGYELIESKIEDYSDDFLTMRISPVYQLSFCILLISVIFKNYLNISVKELSLIIIFILQFSCTLLLIVNPEIFPARIITFFLVFQGFFYVFTVETKNRWLKFLGWGFALFSFINFIRFLVLMPNYPTQPGALVFFQGEPLEKNLYDYITFFLGAKIN
jgi:hypothetical protein